MYLEFQEQMISQIFSTLLLHFQGESGDIKVEVTSDESLAGAQVVLTDNAGKTIAKQSFINGDAGKEINAI